MTISVFDNPDNRKIWHSNVLDGNSLKDFLLCMLNRLDDSANSCCRRRKKGLVEKVKKIRTSSQALDAISISEI